MAVSGDGGVKRWGVFQYFSNRRGKSREKPFRIVEVLGPEYGTTWKMAHGLMIFPSARVIL